MKRSLMIIATSLTVMMAAAQNSVENMDQAEKVSRSQKIQKAEDATNSGKANLWYDESRPWRAVDYDSIAQTVAMFGTPNYYPTLLERYNSADSTLTTEDFRLLYYGYPTQPTYRPLINSLYADSLSFSFGRRTNPTPQEFRRMERYALAILAEEPFSLRDLNVLAFIYQKLGEEELAAKQMFKIEGVVAAIQSSGTGFFQRSPFYITYLRDAEDMLTLLGAKHLNVIVVNRKLEYFPVSNLPTKGMKGIFFNYAEVYKRKPDYIDLVKHKRKFEINPLYNPKSKSNVLPY